MIQLLFEKGADINTQDGYYRNALQTASTGGYGKVVQLLFEKGTDVNTQDDYYRNAL